MAIVLDTSVLPRRGQLRNPVMSAVLRIAEHLGVDVYLVDVVLEEAVNARLVSARDALERLSESINQASKVVPLEDIYLPAATDSASDWRTALTDAFRVIEVHGDDAREALLREAARRRPAREGVGARDSAIWLTVKRRLLESDLAITFVSANTEDFAAADKQTLHPDLLAEIGDETRRLSYHKSLDELIDSMATAYNRADVSTQLDGEQTSTVSEQVLSSSEFATAEESVGGLGPNVIADATLTVDAVEPLRAYEINQTGLAYLRIELDFEFPVGGGDLLGMKFSARAWADFDTRSGAITSIDIETVALA